MRTRTVYPSSPIGTFRAWQIWILLQNENIKLKNRIFDPKHDSHDQGLNLKQ